MFRLCLCRVFRSSIIVNNTIIIAVYCIHTYTPLIYTVQRVYLSLSEVSKGEFTDKMKISLNDE